ncbi:MAG TPA: RNA polymerase sigma-70 factor [Hymenobacter sp.]|jgi:RNA polymerase sigma-70 factor (ECF subfamily)
MAFATSSPDKQYLEALAQGNQAAFDALFTRYYASLVRYAATLLPYPTDAAEDATADAFCALWANREQLAVQGSLAAYLYTAVKHRCFDKLRQQRRAVVEAEADLPLAHPDAAYLQPDHQLAYQELSQHLQHCIAQLPERTRLVFQLHRDGGLTYEEISGLLTISINSVKTHMFRTLRSLKAAFHVSGIR